MSTMLQSIIEEIKQSVTTAFVLGLLQWVLYLRIRKFIDLDIGKQLAKFSSLLKFNGERQTLFLHKKHDSYRVIRDCIVKAQGAFQELSGLRQLPQYENFTTSDIEQILKNRGSAYFEIKEILDEYGSNRENAIRSLRKLLREYDLRDAHSVVTKARNEFILRKIYFSDDIKVTAHDIIVKLQKEEEIDASLIEKLDKLIVEDLNGV